ncbi:amino acid ABC transporter permease [Helcobacillus massiliensis]|uniref:amino acid ABC transporter permease n=1 Tax=Helcobacillus massiliensis TaxID=521392 RepID=UPI0025539AAC|nr:amino acid ABC transporter permease [Helcobacillus massiliensis]MDK7742430.1 amino acid ABC transporter permease [Helcobacillus massiliensis]WOO92483.1 amino acid ABC transporter permease [Helcobacillus massiliensis]
MTRTQRRRAIHWSLYALFILLVIAAIALADWPAIADNFFLLDGIAETWPTMLLIGAKNTILYTIISFTGGFVLALVLVLMKLAPVAPFRWLATAYIELFRGLPALIVILFMAFGVPIAFGWRAPGGPVGAGLLALMMVAAAYLAETLRAGIEAVPPGQIEAARSLGMSPAQTMVQVTLPQALRIVLPPLTNELVILIKDTSLLFVIGIAASEKELTIFARDMMSSGPTAGTATSLTMAAVFYLAITLPLTRIVSRMERKRGGSR